MGRSLLATALAAWSLIGSPALCVAGVIRHACESGGSACRAAADGPCEDGPCESDASGCGHEGDCDRDPCEGLAVRPESAEDVPTPGPAGFAAVEPGRTGHALPALARAATRSDPEHLSHGGRLHPSDMPLLI